MAELGYVSLIVAFGCALYALIVPVVSLQTRSRAWMASVPRILQGIAALFSVAVVALLYLLIKRDFQIEYVANYTDLRLPLLYVISALWAGQKGSLLFWGWLLALCSFVYIGYHPGNTVTADAPQSSKPRRRPSQAVDPVQTEQAYIYIAFAVVLGFFLLLLLATANPFERLSFTPQDGNGLNPLLQNLYMAIHPPILFVGYAGFLIPFALAFAALCTGTVRKEWLGTVRRWTLFAWYFLGIGIILGAHWAYLELGWGGYWAWDPVENASLIPWLSATAMIHTLVLQRRKGLMKLWNLFVAILTFGLCIFATFITRSGMLASVHAFGESTIGYYFLVFLSLGLLLTAVLAGYRWKALRTESQLESLLSKEGAFFFTNQLFMGLGVAVLYGTVYPFLSELFMNSKVVVNTSFFNRISIPIGLGLLAVIGVCQLLPWKQASQAAIIRQLALPSGFAIVAMGIFVAFGIRHWLTALTCALGVFVVVTMGIDLVTTMKRRLSRRPSDESFGSVLLSTFMTSKRLYAGYTFHLGVVLMCLGIAVSSAYRVEREIELRPGETSVIGDVQMAYKQLQITEDVQKATVSADIELAENGRTVANVTPQKRFYGSDPANPQITTEIGLYSSLKHDIYIILAGWEEDQQATFTVIIHPMIIWIWVGGFFVFTVGILVTIIPASRRHRQEESESESDAV